MTPLAHQHTTGPTERYQPQHTEGFNLEELRRGAQADATRDEYITLDPVLLDTNRVTAGVACMYMVQQMLYSGQ
jgi:hypothetical protein